MGPGPPGWRLGMVLKTPPVKNCLLGNQKCDLGPKFWGMSIMEAKAQEVHYGGEGPPWAVVPMKKIYMWHVLFIDYIMGAKNIL